MTTNDPGAFAPGTSSHDPDLTSDGPGATERAQQAAGTAADEAKNVAGTAASEARQVATEAKTQLSGLVDQAVSQVDDQAKTQRDRLVEVLGSLGDDLHEMSSQADGGLAAELTQDAASRVQAISTRLDGREPRELLDDVRDFARRKPGVFLAGALVAGVVAGRLTRGAKDSAQESAQEPVPEAVPTPTPTSVPTPTPVYDATSSVPAQDGGLAVPPPSDLSPSSLPGTPANPATPLATETRS